MGDSDPCSEHPHRKFPCLHNESYYIFEIELYEGQEPEPSEKYGLKLGGPIAVACVLLGVGIAISILKYARHLDRVSREKKEVAEEDKQAKFQNNIVCRRWEDDDDTGKGGGLRNDLTECTVPTEQLNPSDSEDSSGGNFDTIHRAAPEPPTSDGQLGCSECAICSMEFEPGQLVYQSNNPLCEHMHHRKCMEKWLKLQNTCPLCNQPFVLQTV